jgi:hypothetical protein
MLRYEVVTCCSPTGYHPDQLDDAPPRRLLAYALLHRYSDLRWYLDLLPPPPVPTPDALAPIRSAFAELTPGPSTDRGGAVSITKCGPDPTSGSGPLSVI